ncbi:uncharacterized protein LOC26527244 [Drosophila mojavensis]|uniref:DUF4371 domain-containing protein n=1 Tax=Drosophila mojavensis TaxID=7230 RepID=A0A0Q9XJE9_DROMO|nr:uncharacterized protein LOC26527244 [Drosophila mojavensis]KRG07593.1 uncharacterized protein Dmoj_GI25603 [Drosophila mojavensis]
MKYFCGKSKIQSFFKESDNTLATSIKKAEILFAAAIAEHKISMRAMDHISDVVKHAFPDSAIAQGFCCKRTKTASLTYNGLAPVMKEQLISSMKRCVSAAGRPVFSIIIDESTDVSCTKVLACVYPYFFYI